VVAARSAVGALTFIGVVPTRLAPGHPRPTAPRRSTPSN